MEEPGKHSGFGIASASLAAFSLPYFFVVFAVAGFHSMRTGGQPGDLFNFVIGMLVFLGMGICLVGAALGVVGLFQGNRKRVFAVLGLIVNTAVGLGVALLVAAGIAKVHGGS